ncbi:hypothetical protein PF011_g21967 [Phytophthora fragariae]|uniref:Uncharacterized protein n=1 Tax=Phytophthora fragariae TaxID=53985 RepID=A0A6A3IPV4_9STRA|nr:hypothetical protein PF011_g21967 [Phytophthora fragariae]
MQIVVDEGYQVFREKVKRIAEQKPDIEWGADAPIMLKPTNNTTRAQYEELATDESSLRQQLLRLWGFASRRRFGQSAFKLELFIYVTRVGQNALLRRATQARVATAAAQIENHLAEQEATEAFGRASRAYWATSQAQQPEGGPLITPTATTFSQLQGIDEAHGRIDATFQADSNEAEFVTVSCHLNGG